MVKKVFVDNINLYDRMLSDINKAEKYIYLETYRFNTDSIGEKFRDALARKAKDGVEVKLLLDSWGSNSNEAYFKKLVKNGGEVRFFRKMKFHIRYIEHNHNRNHRKILIIDDEIAYIGSSNICDEGLNWRELNLRLSGKEVLLFRKSFLDNFEIFRTRIYSHKKHTRLLRKNDFSIVRDIPSIRKQKVREKYLNLIRNAKKKIILETPYFMPGKRLRQAFIRAVKRGVKVVIILPLRSDVKIMDILRDRYLGWLHRNGVKIYFYEPIISHSKGMIIDNEIFAVGSSNVDYRTFIQQYEIVLIGKDKEIMKELIMYFDDTLKNSVKFEYERWKSRHIVQKIFERSVNPFRRYF